MTLDKYIEQKLNFLGEHFKIHPKANEILHLQSLKNEIQVDNYIRDLLKKYL